MSDPGTAVGGASPLGARSESEAAVGVRQMFDQIAPRYDLLNHVLSCGIDHWWWARTAKTFDHILKMPDSRVLDLCCGTGDMALAAQRRRSPGAPAILAVDFSHPMLVRGAAKFEAKKSGAKKPGAKPILPVESDALNLPFADGSFRLVTSAFGFRNLANYEAGLRELWRVLESGGEVGILDFSEPEGLFGAVYLFYFRRILPRIGAFLSRRSAYEYLPASVQKFPKPKVLLQNMESMGFVRTQWIPYTFGIAGLYRAAKP